MNENLRKILSEISSGTTDGRLVTDIPVVKEYASVKSKDGLTFLLGTQIKDALKSNELDSLSNSLINSLQIKSEQDLKNFAVETNFLQSNAGYKELLDSMSTILSGKTEQPVNEVKVKRNFVINENWDSGEEKKKVISKEDRGQILETIKKLNFHGKDLKHECDYKGLSKTLKNISAANETLLGEQVDGDWFDGLTVKRNCVNLNKLVDEFEKTARECDVYQQRLLALWDEVGTILSRYYEIEDYSETPGNESIQSLKRPETVEIDEESNDIDGNREDDCNTEDITATNFRETGKDEDGDNIEETVEDSAGMEYQDADEDEDKSSSLFETILKKIHNKSIFNEIAEKQKAKTKPTEKVANKHKEKTSLHVLKTAKNNTHIVSGMTRLSARKHLKTIGYKDKQLKAIEDKSKAKSSSK